jgi:hypothetical protein
MLPEIMKIEKTSHSPEVRIEPGLIQITGRSIPDDSFSFYVPVIESVTEYLKQPSKFTNILVHLEYVNSSSKKYLLNIFKTLDKSFIQGNEMAIKWVYDEDDESIFDLGIDIKSSVKIPLRIEEIV